MKAGLRWLCAVVLLLCSASLHAQDDPIARGVALRREGKNAEALAEFERAYAASPSPRALAQIALAQQALGNWVAAESGLVEALAARDDAWIERSASTLQDALATVRDHLASLYVDTDTAGATIFVAGHPAGTAPLASALRVPSGDTWVELRAPGHESQSQALHLSPRSEQRVRIDLPKLPQSAIAPAPAAATAAAVAPQLPVTPTPPPPAPPAGSAQRTAGIVLLIASGAFLAGAITAHVVWQHNVHAFNDDPECAAMPTCSGPAERNADTARTLAIIGYSAAGAAALTGVLLLVTAPHRDRFAAQLTLAPGLAAIGVHAAW